MRKERKLVLGISAGDLNGIGMEVVLKTFADARMTDFCTPVVFASSKDVGFHKKTLNLDVHSVGIDHIDKIQHGKLNVLNVWKHPVPISLGTSDKNVGKHAFLSLEAATKALKNEEIDALVTAPINKENIQSEEFRFQGHTEYLEAALDGKSLMLMISGKLRVGLLTNHLPIKDVAHAITPEVIEEKVHTLHQSLKQDFRIRTPKIAVLGINPHVGDNGLIGNEDQQVLAPTIQKLYDAGKMVFGPYPADGFFGSGNHLKFDAVLASYHDQGLVPFKTLSFGNGVNYTAGLRYVRTSPDHGVAYEIAGKGKADESSFKEAVFAAIQICRTRAEYKELTQDPLKKRARSALQKSNGRR